MANITILEALNRSLTATKKYVDDKTEILPVANKYIIFEDAVPRLMEDTATYGTSGGINGAYIFDNLQNTDMIVYSAKFNLIISFNDGTEDITKNITVNVNEQTGFTEYVDDYSVDLDYDADMNLIAVSVIKGVQTDNGYNEIPCTVTKATFICILYSGLLKSNVIEDIEYKKITNVPIELYYLTEGQNETLRSKEYYDLYDNSFVWDMNKINERLDENSGVTRNTFSTTYNGKVIKVNQKDSEGIGFGQLVPIKRDKNVAIFVRAQQDVIIKVYNPNTKELIFTMEDIYINSYRYAKYSIPFHKVRDIDNIFIAFTIKDIPTDSFSNNTIYDLMVIDESTFLKKKEILTKANTKEYIPTEDYNPATKKYVDDKVAGVNASTIIGLATVATSGDYNDLTNKPTIPTVTNDLTNALKSNYDTAYTHSQSAHAPVNAQKNSDITKAEIEAKLTGNITSHTHSQYLTEHQDISGLAPKANPSFTGNVTVAGKVTVGTAPTENMDVATKQYVDNAVAAADYGPYSIRYNSENNRLEFIYTPTN